MKKLALKIGEEFWLKPGQGIEGAPGFGSIGEFISAILPNIYILAGVVLFFLLIGGGITVIVGAGREDPEGAARGKQAITAAIVGFIIVFASYWIVQIIEIITGIDILGGGGL